MLAYVSKRVILPGALRAIRELKAATDESFRVGRFATTCLMSAGHLSNIEAGRKAATDEAIQKIATHLGVPVDAFTYIVTSPQEAAA